MTVDTSLLHRETSVRVLLPGILSVLTALAANPTLADPTATAATLGKKISLSDLDLTTPSGTRAAYDRLRATAQHLCWELADDRRISFQATYFACVRESVANAVRQIHSPALTAVYESRATP